LLSPSFIGATHKKSVGNGKTRKNAKGVTGGGTGHNNSGFRHVDDCLRTHETVGRIEKPGEKLGSIFRVFIDARFTHFVYPLPFGIFYATIEDSLS
jgi:hypothetical protein